MSFALPLRSDLSQHDPYLLPNFADLRSECLIDDMKNYRSYHAGRIYSELHCGMNGIEATRQFSLVNHYIANRLAEEILLKIDSEAFSAHKFFEMYNLAAVLVGGTGAKTMAPLSDFDLLVVVNNADQNLMQDKGFRNGLQRFHTLLWDTFHNIGFPDISSMLYMPEYLNEDIKDKDKLQAVTGILNSNLLFGSQEIYDTFLSQLKSILHRDRNILKKHLIEELCSRHEKYSFCSRHISPDIKEAPGFLRDIDNISWMRAIVELTQGKEAADNILSASEKKDLDNAASIFLQLKFLKHYLAYVDREANSKRVNTLSSERIIPVFNAFAAITPPHIDQGRDAFKLLYQQAENVSDILAKVIRRTNDDRVNLSSAGNTGLQSRKELVQYALSTLNELGEQCGLSKQGKSLLFMPAKAVDSLSYIKDNANILQEEIAGSPAIKKAFFDLLKNSGFSATTLRLMHRSGILAQVLPSFQQMVDFNEIGSYLQYTLDEHCLSAVEALHSLCDGKIKNSEVLYKNFTHTHRKPELILAILLHDVGRRKESVAEPPIRSHDEIGAELVKSDLLNLDLFEEEINLTVKLVRHHSLLPDLAYSLNQTNVNKLESAAAAIASQDFLDMLFVLSWVDKYTSNTETFTPLKQRWLLKLYNNLSHILSGKPAQADNQIGYPSGYLEHLATLPERYSLECDTAVTVEHLHLIDKLKQKKSLPDIDEEKYYLAWINRANDISTTLDLVLVAQDKPGLFRDIAWALYQRGLQIEQANIFTRIDGIACNNFTVSARNPLYNLALDDALKEKELHEIEKLLRYDADEKNTMQIGYSDSTKSSYDVPLNVYFLQSNENSLHEQLCIECSDRPGLAFLIGNSLTEHGLTIVSAKLNTGNRGIRNIFQILSSTAQRKMSLQDKTQIEKNLTELLAT